MALNTCTNLAADAAAISPMRSDAIGHANMLSSYVALLCLGQSDFEAINRFREDAYLPRPWGSIRRLRKGRCASVWTVSLRRSGRFIEDAAMAFLLRSEASLTPLANGLMPLDCDVTPFDNSQTKKEGVSRTYTGVDGYAPIAADLGQEGYCLELELRVGSQHCQNGTPAFLQRVLARARRVTAAPVLLRLDGGNDAIANIAVVAAHNEHDPQAAPVHYVIKWNPRRECPEKWLAVAAEHGAWSEPRPGKRVALFNWYETRTHNGYTYSLRRVMRVTERTIDTHGQQLLVPEVVLEGWWTSLQLDEQTIIRLDADHGTSEQFHSEFKTDLDIERLPSGKFATNALILACAQLAYNILRWIG